MPANLYRLTIDIPLLSLSRDVNKVFIKNLYVDVDDTHIITAPLDYSATIVAGLDTVVVLPATTFGSVYQLQLYGDDGMVLSAFFGMPDADSLLSDLDMHTAYPPRVFYPNAKINWGRIAGNINDQSDLMDVMFTKSAAGELADELNALMKWGNIKGSILDQEDLNSVMFTKTAADELKEELLSVGITGDDAYEVAVKDGFVGTRSEWLAFLVGPKGDKGDTGDVGPKGDPGDDADNTLFREELDTQKLDTGIVATAKSQNQVERTQAQKNSDIVSIKEYGVLGGGVDDTIALNAAFNSGLPVMIPAGFYKFSSLTIDAPLEVYGTGILVYDDSLPRSAHSQAIVKIKSSVKGDRLNFHTETLTRLAGIYFALFTGDGVKLNTLRLTTLQRTNVVIEEGLGFKCGNIDIKNTETENVYRSVSVIGSYANKLKRFNFGSVNMHNSLRGMYLHGLKDVHVDSLNSTGEWIMASGNQQDGKVPASNGLLVEDCDDFHFGDVYLENSLEHGLRFGGMNPSKNWSIGNLVVKNALGSSFKTAPTPPYKVSNGHIGTLTIIDGGRGLDGGNNECLRLSSMTDTTIGSIEVSGAHHVTMALQDVHRLKIGGLKVRGVDTRLIMFNGLLDMTQEGCSDITINGIDAVMVNTAAANDYAITAKSHDIAGRELKNINIHNANIRGFTAQAIYLAGQLVSDSYFDIITDSNHSGYITVDGANNICKVRRAGRVFYGNSLAMAYQGYNNISSNGPFVPASTTSISALFVSSIATPAVKGNHGSWLGFSRLASDRRGAGISATQTGDVDRQVGLSFFGQNSNVPSNEALFLLMQLKHNGTMNFPQLPTSATGLVAGDIWNDAGTLKIV